MGRVRGPPAGPGTKPAWRAARVRGRHGRDPAAARPALRPGRRGLARRRGGAAVRRDRRGAARRAGGALAVQRRRGGPPRGGAGRTGPVRRCAGAVRDAGSCRARWCATASRRCGRTPSDYTGPDGQTSTRRGFFCRVRVEEYGPGRVRPHERTHPGPQGGPAAPDAGDAGEHLADLLAVLRSRQTRRGAALAAGDGAGAVGRGDRRRRHGAPPVARGRPARRSRRCRPRRATRSC